MARVYLNRFDSPPSSESAVLPLLKSTLPRPPLDITYPAINMVLQKNISFRRCDQSSDVTHSPYINTSTPNLSSIRHRNLERIPHHIILSHPHLLPLVSDQMHHPLLLRVLLHELPDKPGIPKLTCNPQILTTPHQRVGFAAFDGIGDALWGKVLHFPTRDGD